MPRRFTTTTELIRRVRAGAYALARLATVLLLAAAAVVVVPWGREVESQRIQVRYVAGTEDSARIAAEKQLGLLDGIEREPRTWSYQLERRGRKDIALLVAHPLVEDTHHIDRSASRVALDRPNVWRPIRALVEEGWSRWLAGLLAFAAALVLWRLRPEAVGTARSARDAWRRSSPQLRHGVLLTAVGVMTALVLPLRVDERPDEASFVHLYEATSLLAGDRPYRDFFEWGAPLPALLSAAAQWLVGYRLIGELAMQWSFTVAGVVVAVHLGIRQAARAAPVVAVVPLILLLAPRTGYHFSKLFCIPIALWLAARYLDKPTPRRSAAMGAFTAVAFLFRHDFAVWAGLSSVLAFALLRVIDRGARSVRSLAAHCVSYALLLLVTLLPWAILVSTGEGLVSYAAASIERLGYSRARDNPYRTLLQMSPLTQLRVPRLPEPQRGVVVLEWDAAVDEADRTALEQRYGLHPSGEEGSGRRRYQIDNVNDPRLLPLRDFIRRDSGIDWDLFESVDRGVPRSSGVLQWLMQMTLLVPIALIASGLWGAYRHRADPVRGTVHAERLLSGLVLAAVCQTLLREVTYFLVVAPVTAALGSQFLWPRPSRSTALRAMVGGVSLALLALTTYAAAMWQPPLWKESVAETGRQVARAWRVWIVPEYGARSQLYEYLRECTREEDRILITGSTPYYVPYYTHRAMAGGHLDWSIGLRDAPHHEAASLALLRQQSVPLVVGREANVLAEFDRYPRIRAYLATNYAAVDGTGGSILYDTRRHIVRTVGDGRRPCFR